MEEGDRAIVLILATYECMDKAEKCTVDADIPVNEDFDPSFEVHGFRTIQLSHLQMLNYRAVALLCWSGTIKTTRAHHLWF